MSKQHLLFLAIITQSFFLPLVQAGTLSLSQLKENRIEFLAVGKPSAIKIRGELKSDKVKSPLTGNLVFNENKLSGKAIINLDALDTGIDMRNQHMKEKYLETAKFPHAQLQLNEVICPAAPEGKIASSDIPFTGVLKLHGKENPVKGTVAIEQKLNDINLNFKFNVKIEDFGIETPSYLGIKVTDAVTISAHVSGALQ